MLALLAGWLACGWHCWDLLPIGSCLLCRIEPAAITKPVITRRAVSTAPQGHCNMRGSYKRPLAIWALIMDQYAQPVTVPSMISVEVARGLILVRLRPITYHGVRLFSKKSSLCH